MSIIEMLPKWMRTNKFYYSESVKQGTASSMNAEEFEKTCTDRKEVSVFEANLVSSRIGGIKSETHYPALDIDFPIEVLPSSTPGHFHLYIKKEMPWPVYQKLLTALYECGIIELGVYNAALKTKETCLRLPWISKPEKDD